MHRNTHVNRVTHSHACRIHTHAQDHTKPHTLPHTPSPPPMAQHSLPPSLSHSPKRREPVKDARRQHADRVVMQVEIPGHDTRRQSALTRSTSTCPPCPSACTCMCPMHMRHARARVHRGSLSLWICAHRACFCVFVSVRATCLCV